MIKKTTLAIAAFILTVVVLIVLGIGMWQLDWFIKEKNVNRAGEIAQQSYPRQVGLVSGINNNADAIALIDVQIVSATPEMKTALQSQRKSLVSTMCDAAANLVGSVDPSASAQTLITKECK